MVTSILSGYRRVASLRRFGKRSGDIGNAAAIYLRGLNFRS